MKSQFTLVWLLIGQLVSLAASAQTDTLMAGDTIHLHHRAGLFNSSAFYSYYGANNLGHKQLWPLLRRSTDQQVRALTAKSHRRLVISQSLLWGSYGLLSGSLATIRRPIVSAPLLLGGLVSGYSGFIINFGIGPATKRAVKRYNLVVRSRTDGFANPLGDPIYQPTVADTVHIARNRIFARFSYRSMRIYPWQQLSPITSQLQAPDINNGFRHSRTLRTIGGIVSGIGVGFVTTYLLSYAAVSGYKQQFIKPDARLYGALGAIGTGLVIKHFADKTDIQTVEQYNQTLRAQFLPTNATK